MYPTSKFPLSQINLFFPTCSFSTRYADKTLANVLYSILTGQESLAGSTAARTGRPAAGQGGAA